MGGNGRTGDLQRAARLFGGWNDLDGRGANRRSNLHEQRTTAITSGVFNYVTINLTT